MSDRAKDRKLTRQRDAELALEKDKPTLEQQKHELERKKFELEQKKTAVNLYIEDFKARWQELLNLESENNRWATVYVTALLLVISWILNNSGRYGGLKGLYHEGDNAYFILAIAIVNAVYTFAMAFKGYQIQRIAQYQYEFLGEKIFESINVPFNEWERYRRTRFKSKIGPEPIRFVYFGLIGFLPTAVSYTILGLYWGYEWRDQADLNHWASGKNWFFIVALTIVTSSLIFSLATSLQNKKWKDILQKYAYRVGSDKHFNKV